MARCMGASTGNVGRVLAGTLIKRGARRVALDECPDMVEAYHAPGRALRADMTRFDSTIRRGRGVSGRPRPAQTVGPSAAAIAVRRGYYRIRQACAVRRLSCGPPFGRSLPAGFQTAGGRHRCSLWP